MVAAGAQVFAGRSQETDRQTDRKNDQKSDRTSLCNYNWTTPKGPARQIQKKVKFVIRNHEMKRPVPSPTAHSFKSNPRRSLSKSRRTGSRLSDCLWRKYAIKCHRKPSNNSQQPKQANFKTDKETTFSTRCSAAQVSTTRFFTCRMKGLVVSYFLNRVRCTPPVLHIHVHLQDYIDNVAWVGKMRGTRIV